MIQTAVGVIARMLATRLSKSIGKKGILKISFSIQFIHALAAWFLITPDHPYLQVIAYAIGAAGNMTFFLMLHSMPSGICDADELENAYPSPRRLTLTQRFRQANSPRPWSLGSSSSHDWHDMPISTSLGAS